MNRHERDDFYGGYEGYSRDDEHYHSGRNLTDEFERDWQRSRGNRNSDYDRGMPPRTYHEGNMGDAYERLSRERGRNDDNWYDHDNHRGYTMGFNEDRNRYSNYQDDYRSYQNSDWRDRDNHQDRHGHRREGYLMSYYDGTFGPAEDLDENSNQGHSNNERSYYSGSGVGYRSSDYGDIDYSSGTNYGSNYGTNRFSNSYRDRDDDVRYNRNRYDTNWY